MYLPERVYNIAYDNTANTATLYVVICVVICTVICIVAPAVVRTCLYSVADVQ